MNKKKAFFYPSTEGNVPKYFSNIANLLNTKLAAKYGVVVIDIGLSVSYKQAYIIPKTIKMPI